ncbi:hypothetical protein RN001_005837 [Aquatica leii]|uniref:Uncharacterized protein n=1 Tax=Aquatica leii TaxID=1421715 RepID=A0AAN7PD89_9COLE|nr:hypothetical protein RN001_005837 [Aquatica leii]
METRSKKLFSSEEENEVELTYAQGVEEIIEDKEQEIESSEKHENKQTMKQQSKQVMEINEQFQMLMRWVKEEKIKEKEERLRDREELRRMRDNTGYFGRHTDDRFRGVENNERREERRDPTHYQYRERRGEGGNRGYDYYKRNEYNRIGQDRRENDFANRYNQGGYSYQRRHEENKNEGQERKFRNYNIRRGNYRGRNQSIERTRLKTNENQNYVHNVNVIEKENNDDELSADVDEIRNLSEEEREQNKLEGRRDF